MLMAANTSEPMTIHIKNLRLRTIIGIHDWERDQLQDVIINIKFDYEGRYAIQRDRIADTVDYKKITKRIIDMVNESSFFLLDALAGRILDLVLKEEGVIHATVAVDKPHALRFADSVSITCSGSRGT